MNHKEKMCKCSIPVQIVFQVFQFLFDWSLNIEVLRCEQLYAWVFHKVCKKSLLGVWRDGNKGKSLCLWNFITDKKVKNNNKNLPKSPSTVLSICFSHILKTLLCMCIWNFVLYLIVFPTIQSRSDGKMWTQSCLCFYVKNFEHTRRTSERHVHRRMAMGEAAKGQPAANDRGDLKELNPLMTLVLSFSLQIYEKKKKKKKEDYIIHSLWYFIM